MNESLKKPATAIAIIGMAGRFPGARNLEQFWQNLRNGTESLRNFSDEELLAAGVDPRALENPAYVKAGTHLDDAALFDAGFFGVSPREAEVMDPQHRAFLECSWEALEDSGYDSDTYAGSIAVFAGSSMNTYATNNLLANADVLASAGGYQAMIGNDKDFLTTRVSYKLNLRGPSIAVQTACSTSLVAIQLACQSLLSRQCDIALAGGVSINFPQNTGYLYQEGMIFSPDGHCRPFDANAGGIRAGEGVGIVVLKCLDEALKNADNIHAIILGAAINNDGSGKVGYTAPSVAGQAAAVASAQSMAEVDPRTITYVEAHGTATPLGDPIEVAALTKVFSSRTREHQFCGIGSVKSNIGHLDAAAGVAGLIKTVLAMKHRELPPTLNFESANPQIDFANSPFHVITKLAPWNPDGMPRRAGVSSFGIGGTNAHVVLEEAPVVASSPAARPNQIVVLSARSKAALDVQTHNLVRFLTDHPETNLADAAYTLQNGRRTFDHRKMVLTANLEDARRTLESNDYRRVHASQQQSKNRPVVFLFSGQGSQYPNMGAGVYREEKVFREHIDQCAELLRPHLGCDLRAALYPELFPAMSVKGTTAGAADLLNQTWLTQPALFATEYALAKLWTHWGIEPRAMLGHSIGEYVAACLAGVFTLSDALALVAARGDLMYGLPKGAMLAVNLSAQELRPRLPDAISIAAVNGPSLCVVSGPFPEIDNVEKKLEGQGVGCQRVRTSHAFHSAMMDGAIAPFVEKVAGVRRNAPKLTFLSNVTGAKIADADAIDPHYWGRHLRATVLFSAGVSELAKDSGSIFLEVGPGHTLKTLTRQVLAGLPEDFVLSSLPQAHEKQPSESFVLNTLGRLWLAGAGVSWQKLHEGERRHRISLPNYPFERTKYFIERPSGEGIRESARGRETQTSHAAFATRLPMEDWFWVPSWRRSVPLASMRSRLDNIGEGVWAVFLDDSGIGTELVQRLRKEGIDTTSVRGGSSFARTAADDFTIDLTSREDYERLIAQMTSSGKRLRCIIHLCNVGDLPGCSLQRQRMNAVVDRAFFGPLFLGQALAAAVPHGALQLLFVTSGMQTILDSDGPHPEKALLLGLSKVLPEEMNHIECRSVDLESSCTEAGACDWTSKLLLAEATQGFRDNIVGYRGSYRWTLGMSRVRLTPSREGLGAFRERGSYIITGGTGGIGLTLAEHLARSVRANLLLISRSGLPPRSEWPRLANASDSSDPTVATIRRVQEVEALGSHVIVASADVANEAQMRDAVGRAKREFGSIHGVIHAAGLPGGGLIELMTRDAAESVLSPKLHGTLLLDELLADEPLDFFLLCSSINSILGVVGSVDYTAANCYLDSLSMSRASQGRTRMISVNWVAWSDVGMAARMKLPPELQSAHAESMRYAIRPQEAIELFDRIVASKLPQLAVATRDLGPMLEAMHVLESRVSEAPASREVETASTVPVLRHARPELPSAYLAPRNEQEQSLAAIWSELLGIDSVGVNDNFFDLGGHSLLGTRILSRIQEVFKVSLTLRTIFELPTIAELAGRLQTVRWAAQSSVAEVGRGEDAREEIEL
jgi:acyl transferase domain-containing protein